MGRGDGWDVGDRIGGFAVLFPYITGPNEDHHELTGLLILSRGWHLEPHCTGTGTWI